MSEAQESAHDFKFIVIGNSTYGIGETLPEAMSTMTAEHKKHCKGIELGKFPRIALIPRDYKGKISWDYIRVYGDNGETFQVLEYKLPKGVRW